MDETYRAQIKANFDLLETEDLEGIWRIHDTDEWTEEAFIVLREVLLGRLGTVPEISTVPPLHRSIDTILDLRKQGAFSSALYECEQAVSLAPGNPKAHFLLGLTHRDMGNLEKAISAFSKAVNLDPDFEDAANQLKSVEKELDKRFEKSAANDHLDRAMVHAEDEDMDMALREIELAKDSLPELASAYTKYGEALTAVNRLDEAIESFQKAILLNPEYPGARAGLRNAKVMQEDEPVLANLTVDPVDVVEVEKMSSSFDEKEFEENQDNIEETPGWVYLDKQALLVRGSSGHRNRPGRSGLDPMDTQMDAYRFEGGLIRRLFTGHLRTKDPLYLVLMSILGLIFSMPLLFLFGPGIVAF